jgi:hypothetical protein
MQREGEEYEPAGNEEEAEEEPTPPQAAGPEGVLVSK